MSCPKYDIVIWGATGFTGSLCAKYLAGVGSVKYAIAGRSDSKLALLRDDIKKTFPSVSVDIIVANLDDSSSLDNLVTQGNVIISTAGPFAKVGTPIIDACIRNGVHYVDITGEIPWVRKMIDKFHDNAQKKKLRIVNCCGYDCIPADIGAMMMADALLARGKTPREVRMLLGEARGSASGGTFASAINIVETMSFADMRAAGPFSICPRDPITNEPLQPIDIKAVTQASDSLFSDYDKEYSAWTMPYLMQAVDTRIVHRSNAVSGYKYGRNFIFTERLPFHMPAMAGFVASVFGSMFVSLAGLLLVFPPTRSIIKKLVPQPGSGPDEKARDQGFFKMLFWGKGRGENDAEDTVIYGGLDAPGGDPGYKLTSMMVCESALCIARDESSLPTHYGVITPSTAFGNVLLNRLNRAGMKFFLAEDKDSVLKTLGMKNGSCLRIYFKKDYIDYIPKYH
eukprot:gene1382-2659_t